jgi:GTP pyrophosphokinase
MRFVKTARARNKINHWIRLEERSRSIELGREICEKAFKKQGLNFSKLLKRGGTEKLLAEFKLNNEEELFASIGYGRISAKQLLNKCIAPEDLKISEREPSKIRKTARRIIGANETGVIVKEIDDIMVKFGKCCKPLPGEKISGYITRGRGVTVHRYNCAYIQGCDQERIIDVRWDDRKRFIYPVKIEVTSIDKKGLLAEMSAAISAAEANISNASARTLEDNKAVSAFDLEVSNFKHLQSVIRSIEQVKGVIKVNRLNP